MGPRALELFSGLGGWRYALEGRGQVVAAYDISPGANATYALNHGEMPHARELATLPPANLLAHQADLWMMSPPCQPFCRMGKGHDLQDPRSSALLHLMDILDQAPPWGLVLENVAGFYHAEARTRLLILLKRHGFHHQELMLCPTRLGIPNQRPRYYLAACRDPLRDSIPTDTHMPFLAGATAAGPEGEHPTPGNAAPRMGHKQVPGPLSPYLDDPEDPTLYLTEAILAKHKPGLDLVRPQSTRSACFIGGYGQRYVGSGSFLITDLGIRRFSPREILRLMRLPATFQFPDGLSLEKRYKLLGNGLSIPAAREVLGLLPMDASSSQGHLVL